jgi:tRNA (guanine-N7-)-methyltransferase|tara:strand:+ start:914 stop:1609 length:696 start_codon:yes stop_codon:yes gene_type:complete
VTDIEHPDHNRPLRSFVIRASRLTAAQQKALDTLWEDYVVPFQNELLDLNQIFPNQNPITVEIGFGMGDSLLEMAIAQPNANFLGMEVHRPGVGKLLHGIEENGIKNLKIVSHDAVEVLESGLAVESIDKLLIYFPDPWHKKRHNKRRLIQHEFVQLARSRLKIGAEIHLATDWEHYAEHMMEVMSDAEGFENSMGLQGIWKTPDRPETKFERRGIKLGHGVWDLLFKRLN